MEETDIRADLGEQIAEADYQEIKDGVYRYLPEQAEETIERAVELKIRMHVRMHVCMHEKTGFQAAVVLALCMHASIKLFSAVSLFSD